MFDSIQSCLTWECINSFGSWVAAFGTILISALALRLSWQDRLIRVNAKFDYGFVPTGVSTNLNQAIYVLEITNIGRRVVTLTNYEWIIRRYPKFWRPMRVFTFVQMDEDLQHLTSKFPLELTDGQQGLIFHKDTFFEQLDEKEKFLFSNSRYKAFLRIFDFKIVLSSSGGDRIKVKIPFRVRRNIWSRYLKS